MAISFVIDHLTSKLSLPGLPPVCGVWVRITQDTGINTGTEL